MTRRALGWLCLLTAALLAVAELLGLTGVSIAPHQVLWGGTTSPFLACALAGAFPLLLGLGRLPRRASLAGWALLLFGLAVAVGAPLRWVDTGKVNASVLLVSKLLYVLGGLGLLGLLSYAFVGDAEARGRTREVLAAALLLPAFVVLSDFLLPLTTRFHPRTHDAFLYAFEQSLGLMPCVWLSQALPHLPVLAGLCRVVYMTLPLAFVALLVLMPRGPAAERLSPILGFVAVGAAGYVIYHLYPVVGPKDFFGAAFPDALPPVGAVLSRADQVVDTQALRNCVPSLHTAWALTAFWYARPLQRAWRVAFGAVLALTVLATLGLGYHYFGDVVVAVPFSLAVLTACERREVRASPLAVRTFWACVAAVVLWLLLFRFGARLSLLSPAIGWTLSGLTVALCVWGERRVAWLRQTQPWPLSANPMLVTALVPPGR
jgi:hypothetical protein